MLENTLNKLELPLNRPFGACLSNLTLIIYCTNKFQRMNKTTNTFLVCGFITLATFMNILPVAAQQNLWGTKNAYLGQQLPGDEPEIFGHGLLKDSGIVLGKVSFSKDGSSLYYSYARHWFDSEGSGTKEIRFDGKKWQKPIIIAPYITNPALSPNEQNMYLGAANGQVWLMKRSGAGWSAPLLWMEKSYGLYNFQEANSGTFYTGSNGTKGSKKDWSTYDFCKLNIKGRDTTVASLGPVINTPGFDGDFFIAPNESYIIISAKETPDYQSELWISFRKNDGSWSVPVSLGDKINNGPAHRFGQYVTPDGKYLIYTKGTSEADCNFYWVRFDTLVKRLRANSK